VKLTQNLAEVIEAGGTRNPEALDAYFKARGFAQHGAQKELEQALKYLNEAIRADANYAEAFVDRSSVESNLAGAYDPIERIRGRRAEARKDAEQAIKLAPRMAGAYARYADLLIESVFDFRGAQQQFSKAAELAPNDEHVMASRARFESFLGHHDEAVALSRRLIELNPGSGPDYYDAAIALLYAGEVDEALRDAEHTQSLGTDFGLQPQCGALIRQHRYEQVVATCPESDDPVIQTDRTVALHALNRPEEARLMLEKLLKDNGESAAYQYAEIYSQNGEADTALHWLEKAYELRDSGLVTLKQDFLLDPIRKEPRFQAVLRKMDFPP
jgi:tetratricopeptide (TPR) repeat protein